MNPEIEKTKQVTEEELAAPQWDGEPSITPIPEGGPTAESVIGTVVEGYYQIQEIIGKGGMSSVYKARHQLLNKNFAIKMLHPHLVADESSKKRFKQEAQAVSALDHPNIIRVSSFGMSGQGMPYIIMDYLQGESLAERTRYHSFKISESLRIFVQTCRALAHAHSKGIVHRDVKPSNIMLVEFDGDPDFVKIVDFGIAKLLPQEGEQVHRLTQTGEIFGSPLYMCPEQWLGKGVDTRSDIYSLGCVIYEILCKRAPFHSQNVFETMNKHLTDMPPPMTIEGAPPALIERLESIIFKALEKDPDKRWQTMTDLAVALSEMEDQLRSGTMGRSINARLTRHQRQLKKFFHDKWKPHYTFIAAGLIPVAIIGGLYYSLDLKSFAESSELHPLPWPAAVVSEKKSEPPPDFQNRLRDSYHFIHLATVRRDEPEVLRDLWGHRALVCEHWGLLTEAIYSRAKQLSLEGGISSIHSDDYCRIAEELIDDLLLDGSIDSYRKADDILEQVALNRNTIDYNNCKTLILEGDVKTRLKQYSEAEEVYEAAVRNLSHNEPRAGGFGDERVPFSAALIKLADLKLRSAQAHMQEALKSKNPETVKMEKSSGNSAYLSAETLYAQALAKLGQIQREMKERPELKIDKAQLDDAMLRANVGLAFVDQQLGKYDQAKAHYMMALPGVEASLRVDWAKEVLTNYAFVLWKTNSYIEALQIRGRAKALKA